MKTWKTVAASVRGRSHETTGEPCQDAHAVACHGDLLIAVVCDGAGSASHSDHGARHGAQCIVDALARRMSSSFDPDDPEVRVQVTDAIGLARDTVLDALDGCDASLSDCHATVVGCMASPSGVLFFQIGDGAGAATAGDEMTTICLSQPENGEFADTTFFYTQASWKEHLRFTSSSAPADLVLLMSDGAMGFAMAKGCLDIERRFVAPVTRFLSAEATSEHDGAQALEATLSSDGASAVSDDDKTLLWARWSASPT